MRLNPERPKRLSRRLWIAAAVLLLAFLVAVYWCNRPPKWTLTDQKGKALCRVQQGWTEQEVASRCGLRSGRGMQPKVPGRSRGFIPDFCSAPGDVYGNKVVLYGCDLRVATVEDMPDPSFIYPSN